MTVYVYKLHKLHECDSDRREGAQNSKSFADVLCGWFQTLYVGTLLLLMDSDAHRFLGGSSGMEGAVVPLVPLCA